MMNKASISHVTRLAVTSCFAAIVITAGAKAADTQLRTSSFTYTAQGLLSSETVEPNQPAYTLTTTYQYDTYGNRISSNTAGRTNTTGYGADGRFPVSSVNALGQTETRTYNPNYGTLATLTGPNFLTTHWEYDSFGRKRWEVRADGTSTQWQYILCASAPAYCPDSVSGQIPVWRMVESALLARDVGVPGTRPAAPIKTTFYDRLNRVIRVNIQGFDGGGTNPGSVDYSPPVVSDTVYNRLGQVASTSNSYTPGVNTPVWTTYTYDLLGRILTQSHPDQAATGGMATTSYSYNGLATTVTNPNGQSQTTVKNAQGQVASVTDARGSIINYTYDAVGNLLATNAAGSVTTLQYDQRSRKIAMQDPAMGSWTYTYNQFGELTSQRDSLGQTTNISYDPLGRMVQRTEPDLVSQWSYDKNFDGTPCGTGIGKLCEAKAANGYDRKNTYDNFGRLTVTSTVLDSASSPAIVFNTYDTSGRLSGKVWPTGFRANYSYTFIGYLSSVTGTVANGTDSGQYRCPDPSISTNSKGIYTLNWTTSPPRCDVNIYTLGGNLLTRISGVAAATLTAPTPITYKIMAMDAAGHVTKYKIGNKVTTVKTFDTQTQRLTNVTATADGQSSGNVLNQSYTYDALGNLKTRNDTSPGIGTQESFAYDSLNRLTLASIVGGAVSVPIVTEVMYDPRGNIAYKSDVGRYWYDPARPNRMTNVTPETAPGATISLSGSRALSYTFDDYNKGAFAVNGTTVGNGNLIYTVSRDTNNNIHTARFESYTSFNMPLSMTYSNLNVSKSPQCPAGQTYGPGVVEKCYSSSYPLVVTYGCPSGELLLADGITCVKDVGPTYVNVGSKPNVPTYSCPTAGSINYQGRCYVITSDVPVYDGTCQSDYLMVNGKCAKTVSTTVAANVAYSCDGGTPTADGKSCRTNIAATVTHSCPAGRTLFYDAVCDPAIPATLSYSCPQNYSLKLVGLAPNYAERCVFSGGGKDIAPTRNYYCPTNYIVSGRMCNYKDGALGATENLSCPAGYSINGRTCVSNNTVSARQIFSCSQGQLTGTGCVVSRTIYQNPTISNAADRTLAFTYGPEHQRIRQNITLSGNGTSSYFSGNTWYLNGEDSLGLTYEKEVRANGTTEHKHYLSAGGEIFAQFTSRTGNLNGLPPTSVSYFLHDHLGSISAIADEGGNVTERLAYDPWGKRRNINTLVGTSDFRHELVGKATDRGFTEHEHLDEIGVIHMNGRIYDPLMGRFMSADPFIEAPDALASYNRYTYIWNNPLGGRDANGYCWICNPLGETAKTLNHWGDAIASSPVAQTAITVAIAYYTGYWATNTLGWGAVASGAIGGAAASAYSSRGDPNAIAVGALTGAGFGWAGGVGGADSFARYAAHATVGCASAVAGGGNCGAGAASAVFGKYTTNALGGINSNSSWSEVIGKGVATSIAGGVGSVIAGGKFENGATTAAFGYLFNALSSATIRSLFTKAGHHPFTRQMAIQFSDIMTDDAIDYVSRRTIGESVNWDRTDSNNPHKWSNRTGHPQYNKDALDIGNKYIEANGISKENPMTVRQAADLEMKLRQHEYNRSVQDYATQQMRSGNIRWRGVFRSNGGSSGGQE